MYERECGAVVGAKPFPPSRELKDSCALLEFGSNFSQIAINSIMILSRIIAKV